MFNWCKRKSATQSDITCLQDQIFRLGKQVWDLKLAQSTVDRRIKEATQHSDSFHTGNTVSCNDSSDQACMMRNIREPYDVILLDDLTWGWRVYRKFDGQTVEVYNSHLARKDDARCC